MAMMDFYYDNFNISPLPCWNPYELKEVSIITCRANVFDENYSGDLMTKVVVHNPELVVDGPCFWSYKSEMNGRERVIMQENSAGDKGENKEHCMLLFKDQYIKRGWLSANFNAQKEGIVGIVFKYFDTNNYLILEIGGEKEDNKFFQVRKKVRGKMKLLQRINSNEEIPEEQRKKIQFFWFSYFWLV